MHTVSFCPCGRQLTHPRGRQNSCWTSPSVLKRRTSLIVHSTDYSATATDEGILQLPPKQQLQEDDLQNVFNYERDLQGKYGFCFLVPSAFLWQHAASRMRIRLLQTKPSMLWCRCRVLSDQTGMLFVVLQGAPARASKLPRCHFTNAQLESLEQRSC
jgi:hypothetical protein